MKKAYRKPSAEKVNFDCTETVTASWPCCNNNQNQQTEQQGQNGGNSYWDPNPAAWWMENGACKNN